MDKTSETIENDNSPKEINTESLSKKEIEFQDTSNEELYS